MQQFSFDWNLSQRKDSAVKSKKLTKRSKVNSRKPASLYSSYFLKTFYAFSSQSNYECTKTVQNIVNILPSYPVSPGSPSNPGPPGDPTAPKAPLIPSQLHGCLLHSCRDEHKLFNRIVGRHTKSKQKKLSNLALAVTYYVPKRAEDTTKKNHPFRLSFFIDS